MVFPDGREIAVRYRVVDAAQLRPSHDAFSFQPVAGYPAGVQGRQYHGVAGRAARENTILNAQRLEPLKRSGRSQSISDASILTGDGIAVAENQRGMMLARLSVPLCRRERDAVQSSNGEASGSRGAGHSRPSVIPIRLR